jgi:hypothetical protein
MREACYKLIVKLMCFSLAIWAFLVIPAVAQAEDSKNAPAPNSNAATVRLPATKDELARVYKAYAEVVKSDPALIAEQMDQAEKIRAMLSQQKLMDKRIIEAVITADPSVAAILAAHPDVHPHLNRPAPKTDSAAKPTDKKPEATSSASATPATKISGKL